MDNKFGINDKVYVIDKDAIGVIKRATITAIYLDPHSSFIIYRCKYEDKDLDFIYEYRIFSTQEKAESYCRNKRISDLATQKVKLLDKISEIDREIESLTKKVEE